MRHGIAALAIGALTAGANAGVVMYDFETGLAAQGWTAQASSNGFTFEDMPGIGGNSNYVNNSLNAPIADSDAFGFGFGPFDTSLISPPQAFVGPVTLAYELNFHAISPGADRVEVYYGSTLVMTHTTDTGGFFTNASGVAFSHAVTAAAGDSVRFRYVEEDPDAWEWYAQIDNVSITAVPTPGSLAILGLGGLLMGRRRR